MKIFEPRNQIYVKYKSLKAAVYTIEGIIGVGKTTLGKSLESYLNKNGIKARFFPEYVNKQLLGQYISDMKKYAYAFQLLMLSKRIEIYREAEIYANNGGISLVDRSIIGDMTFARMQKENGNITEDEWNIYLNLLSQEIQLMPSASIFLDCTAENSLERVNRRGIESEIKGYTLEYMRQLRNSYELSISECLNVRHIIIDWNKQKLIKNNNLVDELVEEILDKLL